ncbi:MAG: hypothetical protein IKM59_00920 [Oscillospiraceae bacterium]|nr:hypothetical protein [Oscillospiraceae bacterium]
MTLKEKICKWALLWLLVFSVLRPIRLLIDNDFLQTQYALNAILYMALIATVIQGIIGIIAWFKINRDNERGKSILLTTYGISCGIYGLYVLFLTFLWIVPAGVFYWGEYFAYLTLFGLSAAVLLLQHFWTKYLF